MYNCFNKKQSNSRCIHITLHSDIKHVTCCSVYSQQSYVSNSHFLPHSQDSVAVQHWWCEIFITQCCIGALVSCNLHYTALQCSTGNVQFTLHSIAVQHRQCANYITQHFSAALAMCNLHYTALQCSTGNVQFTLHSIAVQHWRCTNYITQYCTASKEWLSNGDNLRVSVFFLYGKEIISSILEVRWHNASHIVGFVSEK